MTFMTVNFNSIINLTEEQFYQLCINNPDTKFERNADGEIIIMSPTGGETGKRNTDLVGQFWLWNRQTKLGEVFDSSTGYTLPNGANRSPDVSWAEIDNLKMRTTGQGGLVYYFTSITVEKAYLLPMRVAGFNKMVQIVAAKTGIDTVDIRPLSQPWMYLILFVCTMFLWLIDGWTIWTATHI